MTALAYFFLILPISCLPMRVLYFFSDGLSALVFHVLKYRRRVVEENLARSFPERPPAERVAIARAFYRHFADLVVESFKGFTISQREITERFRVSNPEILAPYFVSGRSVILAGGHYGNWEWLAIGLRLLILHRVVGIYKPLSNPFFEKKLQSSRAKYGLELLAMRGVPEFFKNTVAAQNVHPYMMVFGVDQSPGDPRKAHWMKFLNQDTGVSFGAEKYAKEYDLPVFFGLIHKTSRGHYTLEIQKITDTPRIHPPGWIIEEVTHRIEKEIIRDPQYWLWSHRRWKHRRPADR